MQVKLGTGLRLGVLLLSHLFPVPARNQEEVRWQVTSLLVHVRADVKPQESYIFITLAFITLHTPPSRLLPRWLGPLVLSPLPKTFPSQLLLRVLGSSLGLMQVGKLRRSSHGVKSRRKRRKRQKTRGKKKKSTEAEV